MLAGYFEQIKALLADPTSNLVASAMGVSIGVVFLVIIVLVLLFFALAPERRPKDQRARTSGRPSQSAPAKPLTAEQLERRRLRKRQARRIWWTTVLGGLAVVWIALFAGTSANIYCGNTCHPMVGPSDTWKKSPHRQVACIRCHEGTPATSLVTGTVSRARSLYYSLANVPAEGALVPSQRCLSCHSGILRKKTVSRRGISMSHAEPIAAGSVCSDCHGGQGHVSESLSQGMPACLRCHDGRQASTECALCHTTGMEAVLELDKQEIGQPVRLPEKPTCGGCHSEEKCDACHGVRMPHPEDFSKPKNHAPIAAFEKKERVCFRCHTPNDCYACHRDFNSHPEGWKAAHKTYKRRDGDAYCLWCHDTEDYCSICHQ